MEIRIGIQNVSREIAIDTDMTSDAVAKAVAEAVQGGTLDLTDAKGRRVVIPASALGYVDIGEETKRRVGFGA
ncbi:hypothetical protein Lsed01_02107 [Demequina sediminis]|uniref:DUF3107 domain-containing protein n=1 Tax=Demequina sediminis TaxID=1930058 RepID=A0ABP9WIJ8_9MICO|nr:DUF3107 domain-containing protein [Demequina sediminis]BDZ62966.1 ATP-binding protein [Demequina sediminis]